MVATSRVTYIQQLDRVELDRQLCDNTGIDNTGIYRIADNQLINSQGIALALGGKRQHKFPLEFPLVRFIKNVHPDFSAH